MAVVIRRGLAISRMRRRVNCGVGGCGCRCQRGRMPDYGLLKTVVFGRVSRATTSTHFCRCRISLSTSGNVVGGAAGLFGPIVLLVNGGIAGQGRCLATITSFSTHSALRSHEIVYFTPYGTSVRTTSLYFLFGAAVRRSARVSIQCRSAATLIGVGGREVTTSRRLLPVAVNQI